MLLLWLLLLLNENGFVSDGNETRPTPQIDHYTNKPPPVINRGEAESAETSGEPSHQRETLKGED